MYTNTHNVFFNLLSTVLRIDIKDIIVIKADGVGGFKSLLMKKNN